jgi:hypothetical protein
MTQMATPDVKPLTHWTLKAWDKQQIRAMDEAAFLDYLQKLLNDIHDKEELAQYGLTAFHLDIINYWTMWQFQLKYGQP